MYTDTAEARIPPAAGVAESDVGAGGRFGAGRAVAPDVPLCALDTRRALFGRRRRPLPVHIPPVIRVNCHPAIHS